MGEKVKVPRDVYNQLVELRRTAPVKDATDAYLAGRIAFDLDLGSAYFRTVANCRLYTKGIENGFCAESRESGEK